MYPSPNCGDGSQKGLLLVAFGTSQEDALHAYAAIDADFRRAFRAQPVVWAYTSQTIRNKMAKRGVSLFSIDQALEALARENVRELTVQSLHVVAGEEFAYMERAVLAHALRNPGRFERIVIGRPLLESLQDRDAAVAAVLDEFPQERTPEEAIVFMGHGHEHGRGDMILHSLGAGLGARDPLVHLAAVEGALHFDATLAALKIQGVRRIWLQPFMIVTGEHAKKDLMGEGPDSWASRISAAGLEVCANLRSLGEHAGIRAIFVKHAMEARDDILFLKAD